ncbi:glycosyltransferase [Acetobacter peroxydans]|uniref:glycosyltransferase n=1 Tax=Acetobacter peroxydans TaxID=104098 RepID=UPI00114315AC|nr:glycosyltransferase [Acetobacter peroxydans]NHO17339.1 glycosyltransferase [Acetobacter peroxydans]
MSTAPHHAAPSEPTRVLFINDTSRNGGPGKTLLCLLRFLDPRRINRTVLLPREDTVSADIRSHNAADTLIIEPALLENVQQPVNRAMTREDFSAPLPLRTGRSVFNVLRATAGLFRLIRRVRKERYQLIFCNGTTANLVGGVVAMATGVPAIWHVFYPDVPAPIRGLHRFLARSSAVRAIFCVSAAVSGQFAQCRDKTSLTHDALDLEEFQPSASTARLRQELNLPPESVIFGAHGRVIRRKGFVELVQAAHAVLSRLSPEEKALCHFVILGDTPQDMAEDHLRTCQELAHSLGLDRQVHFLGFRADVIPYVSDFDVVLVPSVYPDPLPRAVMEAMALSRPVIAFDMGGIGEMITDGVQGRLLCGAPPDIDGMAEACLAYFHAPALRLAHGQAGRARVEREFEARTHAQSMQEAMLRFARSAP